MLESPAVRFIALVERVETLADRFAPPTETQPIKIGQYQ